MEINVWFQNEPIDTDKYCERVCDEEANVEYAKELLEMELKDKTLGKLGHRNNPAVNCCIALYVLGYDPEEWFDKFLDEYAVAMVINKYDFMLHVERITPYLKDWANTGINDAFDSVI